MKQMKPLACATLSLTVLLASCSGQTPTATIQPGTIGSNGGEVKAEGGNASLAFPAGAVPAGTVVNIKAATATSIPEGQSVISGTTYQIDASNITSFSKAVPLTLKYTAEALTQNVRKTSLDATLQLCKLGAAPSLIAGGKVDSAARSVTANISTPGMYGICQPVVKHADPSFEFVLRSTATPSTTVGQGVTIDVGIASHINLTAPITITLEGAPQGVTAESLTLTKNEGTYGDGQLKLSVGPSVTPGEYPITLLAQAGSVSSRTSITLTVNAAVQVDEPTTLTLTGTVPDWTSTGGKVYAPFYSHKTPKPLRFDGTLEENGDFSMPLPMGEALDSVMVTMRENIEEDASRPGSCTGDTTASDLDARTAVPSGIFVNDGTRDVGFMQMIGHDEITLTAYYYSFVYADRPTTYAGTVTCTNSFTDPDGNTTTYTEVTDIDVMFTTGWNVLKMAFNRTSDTESRMTMRIGEADGPWQYFRAPPPMTGVQSLSTTEALKTRPATWYLR